MVVPNKNKSEGENDAATNLARLLDTSMWLLTEKVFRLFFTLLIGVMAARYLGPKDFGLFSLFFVVVSTCGALAKLGLDDIALKLWADKDEKLESYFGTLLFLKILGCFFGAVICICFIFIYPISDKIIYFFAGWFLVYVLQTTDLITFYYISNKILKPLVIVNLVCFLICLSAKCLIVILDLGFYWFLLSFSFDAFVFGIGNIFLVRRVHVLDVSLFCKINWQQARGFLKQGIPLGLSSITVLLMARLDQVMVDAFLGPDSLGQYSANLKIIEVSAFLPMVMHLVFFPDITRARRVSMEFFRSRLVFYCRVGFAIFCLNFIVFMLFGGKATLLLLGDEFLTASALVGISSFRLFFTFMGMPRTAFLITEGLNSHILNTSLLGLFLNLLLNFLLIPIFGLYGAIYATLLSFFLSMYVMDLVNPKVRSIVFIQFKGILTFWRVREVR
jgi:O-antigen/teichoic acid export membrane protein